MKTDLRMCIGGDWVDSTTGARLEIASPATGRIIATLPSGSREDARKGVRAARGAWPSWAQTPVRERARLCRKIAEVTRQRRDALARLLSLEQGKPYHTEALAEADRVPMWFELAAAHIMTLETAVLPVENPTKRVLTIRQPRGVYAIVTPWNFPLGIPSQHLAAALITGNTMAWVPAPTTSACAVRLMECLADAGLPPGVVNLVTGPGPVVGDEVVSHPDTDAVAFTGSTATGMAVAARAAGKPLLMELGGNGPTVVLADADVERAAPRIAIGCFRNAGQVCSSTGRILVHRAIHDELAARLVDAAQRIHLGDPLDQATTMGPMHHEPTAVKVDQHIADARERGAHVLTGGGRAPGYPTRLYYLPTVVADVSAESRLNLEETFGPVAALVPFEDEAEALRYADASPMGLSGAVFTRDVAHGLKVAERLRVGLVNINDNSFPGDPRVPTGGASGKRSGIGRRGAGHILLEMTDLKTIALDLG